MSWVSPVGRKKASKELEGLVENIAAAMPATLERTTLLDEVQRSAALEALETSGLTCETGGKDKFTLAIDVPKNTLVVGRGIVECGLFEPRALLARNYGSAGTFIAQAHASRMFDVLEGPGGYMEAGPLRGIVRESFERLGINEAPDSRQVRVFGAEVLGIQAALAALSESVDVREGGHGSEGALEGFRTGFVESRSPPLYAHSVLPMAVCLNSFEIAVDMVLRESQNPVFRL